MKELGILRVYVVGVVSVDLREVPPNALIASIREGLKSGVDFLSLTKVCVCVCTFVCVSVHSSAQNFTTQHKTWQFRC